MRFPATFVRGRVAQRLVMLFVLVPLALMVGVSFARVSAQLRAQEEERLHELAKNLALNSYERLSILASRLELLVEAQSAEPEVPLASRPLAPGLIRIGDGLPEENGVSVGPQLTLKERRALSGRQPVFTSTETPAGTRIFVTVAGGDGRILWGQVDENHLWWGVAGGNTLPEATDVLVLDARRSLLGSTLEGLAEAPPAVLENVESGSRETFAFEHDGEEYVARVSEVPLQLFADAPPLAMVAFETYDSFRQASAGFRRSLLLTVLAALLSVLLLSVRQIHKSLGPLERLRTATQRIAEKDFDARVEVSGSDEFSELGESFNRLAQQLGRQFHTLETTSEIVRAALSSLERHSLLETVLAGVRNFEHCKAAGVIVVGASVRAGCYARAGDMPTTFQSLQLTEAEIEALRDCSDSMIVDMARPPSYLRPLRGQGIASARVFPVKLRGQLTAAIALAFEGEESLTADDQAHVRRIADHVAVALSNVELIRNLDELNWGTLTALARAVDMKSTWTRGHSERVAVLGRRLGEHFGLPTDELALLHRGGLVHDIGKIGVSASILDKPASLTADEVEEMRRHVQLGAKILEPIRQFADVLPMVWQHHEWWDGNGYPRQLRGEEISLHSRIMAVADVWDALTSPRPYRDALSNKAALSVIRLRSGTQFEPRLVEAFLDMATIAPGALATPITTPVGSRWPTTERQVVSS